MDELPKSSNPIQDERLARFTDQLLSDDRQTETSNDDLERDDEWMPLEETVSLLKHTLKDQLPDPQMKERIRGRLRNEWPTLGVQKSAGSFWDRFRVFWGQRQVQLAAVSLAAVFFFGFILFSPLLGTALPAAAQEDISTAVLVLGLIVLSLIVVWLTRRH